jgi:hypothetical protein
MHAEKLNTCRILVRKLGGMIPLGIPRRKWEDNIKMILEKYEGVVWIGFFWLGIGTSGGLL